MKKKKTYLKEEILSRYIAVQVSGRVKQNDEGCVFLMPSSNGSAFSKNNITYRDFLFR